MARRYNRFRRYGSRATIIYRRGRSFYGRNRRGIVGGAFLAGAAASFVAPTTGNAMADTAILAAAVAPIKGLGPIKGAAQGWVLGKIVQQFVGNPIKGLTTGSNTGGNEVV